MNEFKIWPELAVAIDALPAHWAAAVRAVYLEDRSFTEAAKVLGCSVGSAFNWARDGMKQLRRVLLAA
jgi:DNA-directed RNA polymerase specialized sigma24 family protein